VNRPEHIFLILSLVVVLTGCRREGDQSKAREPTPISASSNTQRFQELLGRWLRPDGGYILEITKVDNEGRVQASYLNPRPIHIANARAVWESTQLRLFVELRDEGYPGCTYTLTYSPEKKQLVGDYFQAAMNETYQIFFVRAEP
jgi:hypothetical protein